MPQSVLSLIKIQASASAECEGIGSTFPLQDVSRVPAWTAPSPIPPGPSRLGGGDAGLSLQHFPAERIVWGLHAGSLGLPGLQLGMNV